MAILLSLALLAVLVGSWHDAQARLRFAIRADGT
jgi:hypothetical protein